MALSKDQIFGAADSDVIEIDIPEWGGSIKLKPMTGEQRAGYEFWAATASKKNSDFRGIRERTIIACAVDDAGEPLFSADDLATLAKKNAVILDRLSVECQRISGLLADDVEEAAKN
jgi:hypothetical protein